MEERLSKINYAKSELKNLKYLQRVVLGFDNKLAEIDHQLIGVSAIDPSKEQSKSFSASNRDVYMLSLIDRKQRIIKERAQFVTRVNKVLSFLDELDFEDRKIVTDVYIKGYTIESVSIYLYMSESGLKKRIDRILINF